MAGVVRKVGGLERLEPPVFMVPARAGQRIRAKELHPRQGQERLTWSTPMRAEQLVILS